MDRIRPPESPPAEPGAAQLALPIDPGCLEPVGCGTRRPKTRRRRGPRQLWLFAPYRQPELPLGPPVASSGNTHS